MQTTSEQIAGWVQEITATKAYWEQKRAAFEAFEQGVQGQIDGLETSLTQNFNTSMNLVAANYIGATAPTNAKPGYTWDQTLASGYVARRVLKVGGNPATDNDWLFISLRNESNGLLFDQATVRQGLNKSATFIEQIVNTGSYTHGMSGGETASVWSPGRLHGVFKGINVSSGAYMLNIMAEGYLYGISRAINFQFGGYVYAPWNDIGRRTQTDLTGLWPDDAFGMYVTSENNPAIWFDAAALYAANVQFRVNCSQNNLAAVGNFEVQTTDLDTLL